MTDIESLSYMKLKKHLIDLGIPKSDVDQAPGKPSLLHLHKTWLSRALEEDLEKIEQNYYTLETDYRVGADTDAADWYVSCGGKRIYHVEMRESMWGSGTNG